MYFADLKYLAEILAGCVFPHSSVYLNLWSWNVVLKYVLSAKICYNKYVHFVEIRLDMCQDGFKSVVPI